jgi:hypothetical protein
MSDEQTTSELVEQFNKGQNHALRIVADLLGTSMPTHQNVASKIEVLRARVVALEAEVLEAKIEAFTETSIQISTPNTRDDDLSGWYDSAASSGCVKLGEWLVEHAGWERHPTKGYGRRQFYRPPQGRKETP